MQKYQPAIKISGDLTYADCVESNSGQYYFEEDVEDLEGNYLKLQIKYQGKCEELERADKSWKAEHADQKEENADQKEEIERLTARVKELEDKEIHMTKMTEEAHAAQYGWEPGDLLPDDHDDKRI